MLHVVDRFTLANARTTLVALVSSTLAALAGAQTCVAESEPNDSKTASNGFLSMVAGDCITGRTTGNSGTGDGSSDVWLIGTAAATHRLYRHTMTLTTAGTSEYTITVRGLNQTGTPGTGGTIGSADVTVQTAVTTSGGTTTWYGFGRAETLFLRVDGTGATTSDYTITLGTTPIDAIPALLPPTFQPGPITFTTVGQGHSTDTELFLYDGNLLFTGHMNDDEFMGPTSQSTLTRNLVSGIYYLAVSTFNTANSSPAPSDDDHVTAPCMDFPYSLVNGNPAPIPIPLNVSISDGTTTTPIVVSRNSPFEIVWASFVVDPIPECNLYCFGDGQGSSCPCGNHSPVGQDDGCLSSIGTGGRLRCAGHARISADDFTLLGSQMPNSSVLYFQGTTGAGGGGGVAFGDGLRCAATAVIRLGTKINVGGASQYPDVGDMPISIRGANSFGDFRTYQAWYRNSAPFCLPATFNLTNGLSTTWSP